MSCLRTSGPKILIPALLLALLPGLSHAAAAGRVVFAAGAPQATDAAGAARNLKRGDDVFSGETLATDAAGRLQVSFADGAYISLQPASTYVIEQYQYDGKQDGSEKAVYRLLKGGVRALTGAIGKQHPDNYRVETPVATIGIRGSGHNSRICAGDCPGHGDGLYHNTWRGLTYVKNNVDQRDVPRGRGVYVAALNLPIQFLDQPPGLTAVDTGAQREEDQEEKEDVEERFQVGDQRDDEGNQIIVTEEEEPPPPPPPPPEETSTVITGIGFQGVAPDDESSDNVDTFSYNDLKLFVRDSDNAPVGFLGMIEEDDGDGVEILELATIDPDAVLAGNDAAAVDTAASLLAIADPEAVAFFNENPAHAEDVFSNGELGLGRWTGGRILVVSEDGETDVPDFTGFQSAHFIYGPQPTSFPTGGTATYDFLVGTRSTSVSGATIGEGVTDGMIFVDFSTSTAGLEMDVTHDSVNYLVSGNLIIDPVEHSVTDSFVQAFPETTVAGCTPYCPTLIDGGFAGPDAGGVPKYIGFGYDIQNTLDVITGVAGFQVQSPDGGP